MKQRKVLNMIKPTFLVVGAGSRGRGYAEYIRRHPDEATVVGVADPLVEKRRDLAQACGIPPENVFTDWNEAADRERFADAVIIATQDAMHVEPTLAFAEKGYHILLEKPMAPTAAECHRIVAAVKQAGIIFGVCHVLRYTPYTCALKRVIDQGTIGRVVGIQRLEPVGYWHHAHSYVRGNWRRESESSSMLLAKSCHDLDWILHVMGGHCESVASFGSRYHFRREQRPDGAAERCLDCGVEATCPYSARKIYLERHRRDGYAGWPLNVLAHTVTEQTLTEALENGPYGRCVYACDNDVVDNQVVNMRFDGGRTAAFTMTAFTPMQGRMTTVFGTHGMLSGSGGAIEHIDFLTDHRENIDIPDLDASAAGGHGGGDFGLMQAFVAAVANRDPSRILTGPDESLESHLMVFAAEAARRTDTVATVEQGCMGQG